jgi:hypothetical protein
LSAVKFERQDFPAPYRLLGPILETAWSSIEQHRQPLQISAMLGLSTEENRETICA